jgi:hypothetical protein
MADGRRLRLPQFTSLRPVAFKRGEIRFPQSDITSDSKMSKSAENHPEQNVDSNVDIHHTNNQEPLQMATPKLRLPCLCRPTHKRSQHGIDPDYRRSGAAVWRRWRILGSQSWFLVIGRV